MSIDRALDYTGYDDDGSAYAADLDDTINHLSGIQLGRLKSVAGTNAITADLNVSTGFSSLSNDSCCVLIPANDTTGAVTLAIEGGSAVSVKDESGSALSSTRVLTAGVAYLLQYNATETFWRVVSYLAPDSSGSVDPVNYTFVEMVTSSGTWTAPYKCKIRFWVIGGGGASGRYNATNGRAGGGGAGGVGVKEIQAASGTVFTITCPTQATGDGDDGGNTVLTGTGVSMIATGGTGGGKETSGTASGGTGGSCSGGDYNYAGGDGGDASAAYASGGGGACGITEDGYDAENQSSSNAKGDGASLGASTSVAKYIGCTMAPFDLSGAAGGVGGGAATPGPLCGGGGVGDAQGGDAVLGGGGGAATTTSGGSALPGQGGIGAVIIEYTAEIA